MFVCVPVCACVCLGVKVSDEGVAEWVRNQALSMCVCVCVVLCDVGASMWARISQL